jgi:Raf kinase inhibitor-like YbhB/YbcL family protein
MKIKLSSTLAALLFFALSTSMFMPETAWGAKPFLLTSPVFKDGERMPTKYGGAEKNNANCVGQNISVPLAWTGAPEGTKSFALIMVDLEGALGLGVVHLVVYGISAEDSSVAEGELSHPSKKFVGGLNSKGQTFYVGPCSPFFEPHHYVFTLIATDLDTTALKPGLTREEVLAALKGHVKGAAGFVLLYSKPQ